MESPSDGHVIQARNMIGSSHIKSWQALSLEHCVWLVSLSVIALPYQMGLERSLRDLLMLDLIVACLDKANKIKKSHN